jgi:hypothetical protein
MSKAINNEGRGDLMDFETLTVRKEGLLLCGRHIHASVGPSAPAPARSRRREILL